MSLHSQHIVLIPSQPDTTPVFDHIPSHLVVEAANTNFIVVGVTLLRLEPMIYHTHSEHANHYTTDAVSSKGKSDMFKIQGRQQKKNYIMYILKK